MSNNKAFKVKNGLDLGEYSKAISDTAVDVFVYDTSKDSDGGAWRKRTQGTSWYNETLNTATRGSRKEFPAVAVIVADTDKSVTIYDGDDPDLPMWMVFNSADARMLGNTTTAVVLQNGALWVALNGYGVSEISFIKDEAWRHRNNVNSGFYGKFKGFIADRNVAASFSGSDYIGALVNDLCNDVAMTVLPNAPIDAATGLPVPTIAVATAGGVSVIKDDGTVVDLTRGSNEVITDITFTNDNDLFLSNSSTQGTYLTTIPSSDLVNSNYGGTVYVTTTVPSIVGNNSTSLVDGVAGCSKGITNLDTTNAMSNYITSAYNTGWMNGNIKLATLSDTDDTDVTGSELVTNGTFDTDTSGWTAGDGATVTWQSGKMRVDGNVGTANQAISTVVGKSYTVSADLFLGTSASAAIYISNTTSSSNAFINFSYPANSVTFTATSTTTYIIARVNAASNTYIEVDNISVRLAEEDRSVNGNGLQVFGTVTKSVVATGADLVAYSGFSASNYLEQPYNSDLDFGTGDFCVMGWVNQNSNTTQIPFWSGYFNGGNHERTVGIISGSSGTYVETYGASGVYSNTTAYLLPLNVWAHVVGLRTNGQLQFFVNGKKVSEATSIHDVSSTLKTTKLGGGTQNNLYPFLGLMALWKVSATAPSPEQIAKIYEDEKVLFQENAQATLYGSSDAVTALAYDDSTELLHVGTSAGRSVFQGLRRVDNTTTAVSAAISASNNLVGEQ